MDSSVTSGERLFTLRQQLKGLSQSATEHFCKLGEIMKEIHDNELWKGEYASFEAFYSDPEFSFKKSSVYHAIKFRFVHGAFHLGITSKQSFPAQDLSMQRLS